MIKCPFTANRNGTHSYCMEDSCAMWNKNKNCCLIAAALTKYISPDIEKENEIENLKRQMKAVSLGFAPFFLEEEKDWSSLQGGL